MVKKLVSKVSSWSVALFPSRMVLLYWWHPSQQFNVDENHPTFNC
jgi:hypothetical protein